jgi:hypothetical protein
LAEPPPHNRQEFLGLAEPIPEIEDKIGRIAWNGMEMNAVIIAFIRPGEPVENSYID